MNELLIFHSCIKCPENRFSFNLNDTVCRICPDSAKCWGGDSISLKPGKISFVIKVKKIGYWREFNDSTVIFTCLNTFTEVCL